MKKRVLVVDDDSDTRHLLTELLAEFDAEVYGAATDDQGFSRFLELGPDLLFIDVLLPRQGGLNLLRRIRGVRGGKHVPVLVMSALYRGTDLRTEAVEELGAADFLRKPLRIDQLRGKVAELLEDAAEGAVEAVTPFAPAEVLSRGSLSSVDVPMLLSDLAFHKTTACLNLRNGRSKKVVFFRDGEIAFAVSNQLRETFGRHLLRAGKVTEEAYEAALEVMLQERRKMGEILVERDDLAPGDMYDAVRQNVLEKVFDVFSWDGGDFQMASFREPPARLPGHPFDVNRVLWDGVLNYFPYERLTHSLSPHLDLQLVPQRDLFELATEVPLEKEDLQFLRVTRRMRGRSLGGILSEVQGEREARFLYFLLLRNYLALARGRAVGYAGADVDRPDLERIRRAHRRLDSLRSRNYFQVLEVPLNAADEKVREAYLHKAKDVHPDMLGPNDPVELRRVHAETFHVIQAAYEALKTEPRRRDYLKFIQEGVEEEVADGSKILEAEALFQKGRGLLKRRRWDEAEAALRGALELNPDEGEYSLHLGMAKMRQAAAGRKGGLEEAQDLFERARSLMPNNPEPYYNLGRLAAMRGDAERAESYYRSALSRSPNHVDSLRELRVMKMREEKKSGRGLSSLLGKR